MAAENDNSDHPRSSLDHQLLADGEERAVIFAVLDSFRQYRKRSHYNCTHTRRQNLYALAASHRNALISSPFCLLETLSAVDDAIDHNADIANAILTLGLQTFGLPEQPVSGSISDWHNTAKPNDMAKAHSTIRQFYRDWSGEGFAAETQPLLELILNDLGSEIGTPSTSCVPKILLPGAGLARILFELSLAGYEAEGNEISWHQLLASNFILNAVSHAEMYTLYPFATTFTNHIDRSSQLRNVKIPDIHPATAVAQQHLKHDEHGSLTGSMGMAAGDFVTSYAGADNAEVYDAVVTVYFVDTAPNVIRYIETVRNCLRNGGVWVNIGPLLWHFDGQGGAEGTQLKDGQAANIAPNEDDGIAEPGSVELTDEEVMTLVTQMGFTVVHHEHLPESLGGYIQDPRSMIQNRYRCSHWVARKTNSVERTSST